MVVLIKSYYYQKGTTPEEKHCLHHEVTKELLSEWGIEKLGEITKLFLDYDRDVSDKTPEWIHQEKKAIRDSLQEFSVDYANGFVFTETDQPNKISFHVIFKRIAIVRKDFHPELEKELFSKILGGEHRFTYPEIDVNVYQKKLWFRLPYGTIQPAKPYPHKPFYPRELSEYIMTLADDTRTKNYEKHPYMINKKYVELMELYKAEREEDEETDLTARQERITEYLSLLKPERFVQQKEWFWLMCLCKGNSISQHLFLDISEKSGYKKFNRDDCIKQWNALEAKSQFGMPLLHKWLNEDGVDWKAMYPSLSPIVRAVKNLETNDFGCTDYGLASVLHTFYAGNLYYTVSHGWIHWTGNKWKIGNDSTVFYPICKMLSDELKIYIQEQLTRKNKKLEKLESLPKDQRNQGEIDIVILQIIQAKDAYKRYRSIQSVSCMKSVLQMSMSLFRDDTILSTFDAIPHLFSFDDNSIDLLTGDIIPITKEQRILTTTGYTMPLSLIPVEVSEVDEKEEKVEVEEEKVKAPQEIVLDLLISIIGTDEVKTFLQNLAIFLYGGNINECFVVWTGIGRNGKGVIDHMMKQVLGNYYCTLPISEITEDSKGQGRTSSEVANCRWARYVVSTEPEVKATLKTGKIKQYTGNDSIDARQLFKEAFSFVPKFTLLIQCNEIPKFSKLDDAIQKRMLVTEFPYQFVEDVTRDYQRPIDETLKTKIKETTTYRDGLLLLLLDTYKESKGKIKRNQQHNDKLQEVIVDNSPLSEFITHYEPSVTFVRLKELHERYNTDFSPLKPSEFKRYLLDLKIKTEEDKSNGMKVFLKRK